jgi:hypothetical protein
MQLTMTKREYAKKPADYRSIIDGKPYLLTMDKATGGTILAPVTIKANPTMATIKSFIRKNPALYIKNLSNFDGMVDCVMPCNDQGFRPVSAPDQGYNHENKLGIQGAWFVLGGRDRFYDYSEDGFQGYEVYNCCGNFVLAIKTGGQQ